MNKIKQNIENLDELISIVVPTQNDSIHLTKLVESLRNQKYKNWNLILVQGKSTSKHQKIIKSIKKNEKRIVIINQNFEKFKGIYGAMNQGINYCLKNNFKWLMFLGSDDLLSSKSTLSVINNNLTKDKSKSFDLLIGSAKYLSSNKKFLRNSIFHNKNKFFNSKDFQYKLFLGNTPCHQASIFKASIFRNHFLYDTSLYLAADLDYFLRISSSHDLNIYHINKNLVNISYTGVSSKQHKRRIFEVLKCYFKSFNFLFLVPFLFRYIRRIISLK